MTDKHEQEHNLIEVKVVYPSAHHPFEHRFHPDALLDEVKKDALKFFDLHEGSEGGKEIRYFLYHDDQKIEDLAKPLSSVAHDHEHVNFLLVKEIITG